MSASLVGSEMCIRDSAVPDGSCQLLCDGRGVERRQSVGGGVGYVRPVWAVSYTHLTLPTICSV
eukprot:10092889-Alexandrium_andersonii.AAC.1